MHPASRHCQPARLMDELHHSLDPDHRDKCQQRALESLGVSTKTSTKVKLHLSHGLEIDQNEVDRNKACLKPHTCCRMVDSVVALFSVHLICSGGDMEGICLIKLIAVRPIVANFSAGICLLFRMSDIICQAYLSHQLQSASKRQIPHSLSTRLLPRTFSRRTVGLCFQQESGIPWRPAMFKGST